MFGGGGGCGGGGGGGGCCSRSGHWRKVWYISACVIYLICWSKKTDIKIHVGCFLGLILIIIANNVNWIQYYCKKSLQNCFFVLMILCWKRLVNISSRHSNTPLKSYTKLKNVSKDKSFGHNIFLFQRYCWNEWTYHMSYHK